MSHSTTATSTYALAKYSKSYPSGPQSNPESTTADWQHFTNPTIRLVLDVKKGAELESVRLRIVWSMDAGNGPDQREVVFASRLVPEISADCLNVSVQEDVDLLTLSCLPQRPPTEKQQIQGLPIKAVYRDAVVGIRYLHPIDSNPPTYRRFQITFLSPVAVLEFIDAISTVCPCKANPSANPPRPMNPPMNPAWTHPPGSVTYVSPAVVPPAPSMSLRSRHDILSSSPSLAIQSSAHPNVYSSSPLRMHETTDFQNPSSSAPRPSSLPKPAFHIPASTNDATGPSLPPSQLAAHHRIQDLQQQSSLPNSSPPTSSAKSTSASKNGSGEPAPLPATGDAAIDPASAILASLRESTSLYDLSPAALEQLVENVVREEGFTKLLESIESMWRVKSYVGV